MNSFCLFMYVSVYSHVFVFNVVKIFKYILFRTFQYGKYRSAGVCHAIKPELVFLEK